MSNPATELWAFLTDMNKRVDGLIERVQEDIEPTQPISREIPFYAEIETIFTNLPATYATALSQNTDAVAGSNIKHAEYTNHSSRVYVRGLSLKPYLARSTTPSGSQTFDGRSGIDLTRFPFNFRWNFRPSITERWYSLSRMLAAAGGRSICGSHLSFREPLIIEPMETFQLEVELLSFGMQTAGTDNIAIVAMSIDGYREGF